MDARRQTALHQQQRARRLAASTDVDTFASLLSRPDLLDCIEALLPRHMQKRGLQKRGQIYFSVKEGANLFAVLLRRFSR